MHTRMRFFSRGSHGRGNQGRGNWNRGPRRPRFSIHFDADSQELSNYFKMDFLIGLGKEWSKLGLKGLPSKPHRSLVSQCSSCSLQPEFLENDRWQDIVHPTISQHRGWPNLSLPAPPPINENFQRYPCPLTNTVFPCKKKVKNQGPPCS
jgi:hypothetical protein